MKDEGDRKLSNGLQNYDVDQLSLLEQCISISDSILAIDEFEQALKAANE